MLLNYVLKKIIVSFPLGEMKLAHSQKYTIASATKRCSLPATWNFYMASILLIHFQPSITIFSKGNFMNKIMLLALFSVSLSAHATSDSNTEVFIPVRHIQSGEYFVQKAPMIGCYGLPKGPQINQLVAPYLVNNLGCGSSNSENINALSCASVTSAVEADDFSTFKKITLNLSQCDERDNAEFIRTIKKVVRLNFATKSVPYPRLILVR
jgi:hypothetical protein